MALTARDELRHPANADYHWRESVYFNFNDAANEFGGWIYLWVVPNQPLRTGMLVSFYSGMWASLSVTERAMAAPDHLLREGSRWLYCFQQNSPLLIEADFDEVAFCGLRLQRREPLRQYDISFDDGGGSSCELRCQFMTPPYDYADGVYPTPPWMATNRYHRAWRASGTLSVSGTRYRIDCTGDSDHSWGQRDMSRFGDNLFKMWSFQAPDGRIAASVLHQGVDGDEVPLGFLSIDGVMASVAAVNSSAAFDENGVQSDIVLRVDDALGRRISSRASRMHSLLGWGSASSFWGYEGVGAFRVEGYGVLPGLSSYFWPSRITPAMLARGELTR